MNERDAKPAWRRRLDPWITLRNLAGLAIVAELLASIRTLAEPYRLSAFSTPPTTATVETLHLGALLFVSGALLTTLPYLFGRYRLSLLAFAVTIAGMITYKQLYLPDL